MRNLSWKKRKVIAILLALLLPISVLAQRGLFQRCISDEVYYGQGEANYKSLFLRSSEPTTTLTNHTFGNPNGSDLTNQTFGAPIGSGLFVMLMAGAGYAALKTNKKTNKK